MNIELINPVLNQNIKNLVKTNLHQALDTMLLEARNHGIEFLIIHGKTPSWNDGEECHHSHEVSVDVFCIGEDSDTRIPYSRIKTTRWNLDERIDKFKYDALPVTAKKFTEQIMGYLYSMSKAFEVIYKTNFLLLVYLGDDDKLVIDVFDGWLN